jgi:hypothetical protein
MEGERTPHPEIRTIQATQALLMLPHYPHLFSSLENARE